MTLVRSCVLPGCPARRPPDHGAYACPDCQQRLVRKLAEIEEYLHIVSTVPGRHDPGPRAKGYKSTPPLRLDVVAAFDPRTEINGDGPDDVVDEVPNIWADLGGWCGVVREEHVERPIGFGPAFLRTWVSWIVTRPWVDEFAADIARVHGWLAGAVKDRPPKPAGRCLDGGCGGPVFRRSDDPRDPRLQCATCRRTYDGFDLVRIRSMS